MKRIISKVNNRQEQRQERPVKANVRETREGKIKHIGLPVNVLDRYKITKDDLVLNLIQRTGCTIFGPSNN